MDQPQIAEIQDMLDGLNRQEGRAWFPCSRASWQQGMTNYLQWFKEHDIAIYRDPRDDLWKLGSAPSLSPAERNIKVDKR